MKGEEDVKECREGEAINRCDKRELHHAVVELPEKDKE